MSALTIESIVEFWATRQAADADGRWLHESDRSALQAAENHGFNLQYPVSPFIGNILDAPVIILNLNGGFNTTKTPKEFARTEATNEWLHRVSHPRSADWSGVPAYYFEANYGSGIQEGKFATINACAYRSPQLQDRAARKFAESLPTVRFHQRWLAEAIVPLSKRGERLVIAHRWGLWKIKPSVGEASGVFRDLKCRAFADIDSTLLERAHDFAQGKTT